MEKNQNLKIKLLTFFLIISVIIIILMGYSLLKLNNTRPTVENINKSEINYIEMTEENYNKYNTNGYQFVIVDMQENNNNTITIKGRVYKEKELPILTLTQYENLANRQSVNILGFEMKLTEDENLKDENNTYAGHDLYIESTNNEVSFYVSKNDDGTANLIYPSELSLFDGTDIYMQTTLDNTTPTTSGWGDITLEKYIKNYTPFFDLKDTVALNLYHDEFIFENGKCISIFFTSI